MDKAIRHAARMGAQVATLGAADQRIASLHIEQAFRDFRFQFEGSERDQVTSAYHGAVWAATDTLKGFKLEYLGHVVDVDPHRVYTSVSVAETEPEFERCSRRWELARYESL